MRFECVRVSSLKYLTTDRMPVLAPCKDAALYGDVPRETLFNCTRNRPATMGPLTTGAERAPDTGLARCSVY